MKEERRRIRCDGDGETESEGEEGVSVYERLEVWLRGGQGRRRGMGSWGFECSLPLLQQPARTAHRTAPAGVWAFGLRAKRTCAASLTRLHRPRPDTARQCRDVHY